MSRALMPDDNAKELSKRGERLFEKKKNLDAFNQEVALQFYPERADFMNERVWGAEYATHLFDSAPVNNRRDLCNMFSSMLRPRGQPWFRATIGDEEFMKQQPVADLCDRITKTQRRLMYKPQAQFSRGTKETDHDYGTFGNGVLSVEVNRARDGMLYRCWHLRDCAWVEDGEGNVNALWRKFKMSARNIAAEFGENGLHKDIVKALQKDPDKEFTVCHVLMPAAEYGYAGKKPRGRMAFASVYYDHDHQQLLRESGSHEFRYVVPRWQTISGCPYAISPAALCSLPDARGLQVMARVLQEAGELSVDPPLKATEGAVKGDVNWYGSGITWVDREYDERLGPAIEPFVLGKNPHLGIELLLRAQVSLKDSWYLNGLRMQPQEGRTAYEASQLVEEFVRANIPVFEPIETTYNAPLLELTASILMRLGAFGNPLEFPREALRGGEIEFAFSNPLQDAIERNKANQANVVLGVAAGVAKINPQVAGQQIDWGEMERDVTRGSGAPATWLRDPDQVKQEQQQRQQVGDVVQGLSAAEQAANVVNTGTDAAAKLQGMGAFGGPVAEAA